MLQPFAPEIQAAWNIFQAVICDISEKKPEEVTYGKETPTPLGKGGLGLSFMDTSAPFLVLAQEIQGLDISAFDANRNPDIDTAFETLCFLLRLTEEMPHYLLKSPLDFKRLKVPWTSSLTMVA